VKTMKISHHQKGSMLVLTAMGLTLLVGIGSLAIDLSHAYTNKTRLQNLADTLALSAAISLNKGEKSSSTPDEELYAQNYATQNTFPAFTSSSSNQEVAAGITTAEINFTFAQDWSSNPGDWYDADKVSDARFARVTINNNNTAANFLLTWFGRLFGFNHIFVSTSAVAGTVPVAPCNVIPIMMCGQTDNRNVDSNGPTVPSGVVPADGVDRDCTSDNDDNDYVDYVDSVSYTRSVEYDALKNDIDDDNPDCYGYEKNVVYSMEFQTDPHLTGYMPGNYGLFDAGSGGSSIKECLAGDTECTDNLCNLFVQNPINLTLNVTSEPGAKVGPIKQGLNTRFDEFSGSMNYPDYKPDSNVLSSLSNINRYPYHEFDTDGGVKYQNSISINPVNSYTATSTQRFNTGGYNPDYLTRSTIDSGSGHNFIRGRRLVGVPFVSCAAQNGKSLFQVLGFGCFFMTHTTDGKSIFGEFVGDDKCNVSGKETSAIDMGFYKVILYKDPFGAHS